MSTTKTLYKNASVIVGGSVCAVLMAGIILRQQSGWNEPSVFPGFRFMCGLCIPLLWFWAGMLVRASWKRLPVWVKVLLPVLLFCRSMMVEGVLVDVTYVLLGVVGFLLPKEALLPPSQNKGWLPFVLTALSAYCYTALVTVKDRLLWGVVIPDHPDMEAMMESILVPAEPMLIIITAWFVAQFAFSEIAQDLASKK